MPRFSSTKTGFFGLSFLKPKNPKGGKLNSQKSIKPFKGSRITDIMLMSVSYALRSVLSCGKFRGHGVERATSSERNGGGESAYMFSDEIISPKCEEYNLNLPTPPSNIDIILKSDRNLVPKITSIKEVQRQLRNILDNQ